MADSRLAFLYEDITITVGTLGANTTILGPSRIDAARENGFRIMKTEWWTDLDGKTATEGPLIFGFSIGLSTGQIKAALEANPQSETSDRNSGDTKLPIWPLMLIYKGAIDWFDGVQVMTSGVFSPKWSVPEGIAANWWIHNLFGSALTTGMTFDVFAKFTGVWLRD